MNYSAGLYVENQIDTFLLITFSISLIDCISDRYQKISNLNGKFYKNKKTNKLNINKLNLLSSNSNFNKMKRIKSNKKGKNIHSPFVYRLVANVLFAPYPFYSTYLKQVFRLVNFFDFEQVSEIFPVNSHTKQVCKLAKSGIHYTEADKIPVSNKTSNGRGYSHLVIFSEYRDGLYTDLFPEIPEVWIFKKTNRKFSTEYFHKLKTKKEIQITIELNQMGIVIFNKNFDKQNYVIKHSFSLPIR